MKHWMMGAAIAAMSGDPTCLAAKDGIPANVTVRSGGTVDKIDWSFSPPAAVDFSRVKRCASTNIQNDEILLRDSAGSFVGPASGKYYQQNNRAIINGGEIFKIVDDQGRFLLAQGSVKKAVFAFNWILRFDMELALDGAQVKMVMRNIKLAMSDTGSSSNDGFQDLRTSYRFSQNYATLAATANAIKACLTE